MADHELGSDVTSHSRDYKAGYAKGLEDGKNARVEELENEINKLKDLKNMFVQMMIEGS